MAPINETFVKALLQFNQYGRLDDETTEDLREFLRKSEEKEEDKERDTEEKEDAEGKKAAPRDTPDKLVAKASPVQKSARDSQK